MTYLMDKDLVGGEWTSSKGNQAKWFSHGWWYKEDFLGYEGLAEYLASKLLEKSTFPYGFVTYELEIIQAENHTGYGCKSLNFLKPGEELSTVEKLIRQYKGISIASAMACLPETKDRISLLSDTVQKITGLKNFGMYVTAILAFDALILNEDRHTHNLAVIKTTDGGFRYCPLYDYGDSFLSDTRIAYPLDRDVYECMKAATSKPFSRSFDKQLDAGEELYGNCFKIWFQKQDIPEVLNHASAFYDDEILRRVETCLRSQLTKYENLLCPPPAKF